MALTPLTPSDVSYLCKVLDGVFPTTPSIEKKGVVRTPKMAFFSCQQRAPMSFTIVRLFEVYIRQLQR